MRPLLLLIGLDLAGFGMVLADIQLRLERFGAPGWQIGATLASMFVVQVVASPLWGRAADRIGRKPVVIACTVLSALSMVIYMLADSAGWVLASRIVAGLGAANVAIAQAWISSITTERERTATMGLVGGAVSAGLIVGPAFGGGLAHMGGSRLVGAVAASLSIAGLLAVAVLSKAGAQEPPVEPEEPGEKVSLFRQRSLLALLSLAAIAWTALACLEGTFARLIERTWGGDQLEYGLVFGFESAIALAVQTLVLRSLSDKHSDASLVKWGLLLQGIGLASMPFFPWFGLVFLGAALYSFGNALFGPSINSWCSKRTDPRHRGAMFGAMQASRSLGFVLGPILGGVLFDLRPWIPYVMAGGVCLAGVLVAAAIAEKDVPASADALS